MGVVSDGSYGISQGLVYSFPLTIDTPGTYKIVKNFKIDDWTKAKMKLTEDELLSEKADAEAALKSNI